MSELDGKVTIVTGGARGIGAAIAEELAALGSQVMVGELSAERAERFDGEHADSAIAVRVCDVRSFEDLVALHDATLTEYGRLDHVVANAGVADWGSMSDGDPERWRAVIETNVLGAAYTIRATLPSLLAQGDGHVVLTASVSGRITYVGEPLYIASKWALVGVGKALRKEVGPAGIKVTLIEPGIVDTPLVSETEEGRAELAQVRALAPADIAGAVAFALTRPRNVDVDELMLSPREQAP